LLLIIIIHPVLVAVFIVAKAFFYRSPIADGFGLVSMLAGVSKELSNVLEGATLSGKLRRPVTVQIIVAQTPPSADRKRSKVADQVEYLLGRKGTRGIIKTGVKYM
jgi:hypothetical protein